MIKLPEGFEPMTPFSPKPNRTFWIFFTLFHPVKTFGQVGALLRCNLICSFKNPKSYHQANKSRKIPLQRMLQENNMTCTWAVAGRNFISESTLEKAVLSSSILSSIDSFLTSPLDSFNRSAMPCICLFFRYSSTWGYLSQMSFITSWNSLSVSVPELSASVFLNIAAISS